MVNEKSSKVVPLSQVTIEERVSKKGNKFLAMYAVVNGAKRLIMFVDKQTEFELYKAGVKL